MPRFFASCIDPQQALIIISDPEEMHHVAHVLRLKPGDEVEAVDGCGRLACGIIDSISRTKVVFKAHQVFVSPSPKGPKVILACAIPKKAKFEMILEKATELGVSEIVPMITARTEAGSKKSTMKDERFLKVILNAVKQSKRLFSPVLHPFTDFDNVLKDFAGPETLVLLPWLGGERRILQDVVQSIQPGIQRILALIGPEGDFTPQEAERAISLGAIPVTLGNNVLKVDTAAIAIASFLMLRMHCFEKELSRDL